MKPSQITMRWILSRENSNAVKVFVDELQAFAVVNFVADRFDLLRSDVLLSFGNRWSLNSQVRIRNSDRWISRHQVRLNNISSLMSTSFFRFHFAFRLDFIFGLVAFLTEQSERRATSLLLIVRLVVSFVIVHVQVASGPLHSAVDFQHGSVVVSVLA